LTFYRPPWSDTRAREVPRRAIPEGNVRVLNRWTTTKPQGEDRFSAHACASPAMPEAHIATTDLFDGSYGTRVSNGTKGRPEGRGGGTG
jgi:hypothetical protein